MLSSCSVTEDTAIELVAAGGKGGHLPACSIKIGMVGFPVGATGAAAASERTGSPQTRLPGVGMEGAIRGVGGSSRTEVVATEVRA